MSYWADRPRYDEPPTWVHDLRAYTIPDYPDLTATTLSAWMSNDTHPHLSFADFQRSHYVQCSCRCGMPCRPPFAYTQACMDEEPF